MIQFNCATCGKLFSVREELAGKNGKCACGAILHVPAHGTILSAGAGAATNVKRGEIQKAISDQTHQQSVDDNRMSPSEKRLLWGGISTGILIVVPALLYFLVFRGKWENDHRQALLDLKTQAASLVAAGNIEDGYHKYQELFALLGNHSLRDDEIRGEMEDARSAMNAAYPQVEIILEKRRADELQSETQLRLRDEQAKSAQQKQLAEAQQQQQAEQEQQQERAKEAEMQAKGYTKIDGQWVSPDQLEVLKLRAEMDALKSKPARVTVAVTWKYNDFVGNKPDTGAVVILIPDGMKGKLDSGYMIPLVASWKSDAMTKAIAQAGAYLEIVGGDGKAVLNHVQPGKYTAVIISNNANTMHDTDLTVLEKWFDKPTSTTKTTTLGLEIAPGDDYQTSHDFGTAEY